MGTGRMEGRLAGKNRAPAWTIQEGTCPSRKWKGGVWVEWDQHDGKPDSNGHTVNQSSR